MKTIDATKKTYFQVNSEVRQAIDAGEKEFTINNVTGHRYIGTGLGGKDMKITINGTAGNDMAAFMNGPSIVVNGNAQDGVGNTMGAGEIVVHGNVGDVLGYGMRGGEVYVKGDAGYRIGIHMKSYRENFPIVVIGGGVGEYCGEYMAGGLLIVLGLGEGRAPYPVGDFVGTGMHGGAIYVRHGIGEVIVGKEVGLDRVKADPRLPKAVGRFAELFGYDKDELLRAEFIKLSPTTTRPYGKIYVY